MAITVYTNPGCGPCGAVKRLLNAEGIPFTEVSIPDLNAAQLASLKAYGSQAPIIVTPSRVIVGFIPALLKDLRHAA
jgi:glutaredoxin-like protein NrdH